MTSIGSEAAELRSAAQPQKSQPGASVVIAPANFGADAERPG